MPLTHKYLLSAHVSESKPSVLPPKPRGPSVRHPGRFQPFFPVWLREALGVGKRRAEGSGRRPGLVGSRWGAAGRPEGAGVDEGGVGGIDVGPVTSSPCRVRWRRRWRGRAAALEGGAALYVVQIGSLYAIRPFLRCIHPLTSKEIFSMYVPSLGSIQLCAPNTVPDAWEERQESQWLGSRKGLGERQ